MALDTVLLNRDMPKTIQFIESVDKRFFRNTPVNNPDDYTPYVV